MLLKDLLGGPILSSNFITFLGYSYLNRHGVTNSGVHITQKELKYGMFFFVLLTAIRHDNPCPRTKPNRLGYTCCTLRSTIKRQAFFLAIAFDNQAFCQSHSLTHNITQPCMHQIGQNWTPGIEPCVSFDEVAPFYELQNGDRISLISLHPKSSQDNVWGATRDCQGVNIVIDNDAVPQREWFLWNAHEWMINAFLGSFFGCSSRQENTKV